MNVVATTPTDTLTTPVRTSSRRSRTVIAGASAAVLVVAGGVTAVLVQGSGHPTARPAVTVAQLEQARTLKVDRLQAQVDADSAVDTSVLPQSRQVTGHPEAAQQARVRLNHELRNG